MAVPGNFTSWPLILKHTELHRGHGFRSITLFLFTFSCRPFRGNGPRGKRGKLRAAIDPLGSFGRVPTKRARAQMYQRHDATRILTIFIRSNLIPGELARFSTRRRRYFSLSFFLLSSVKIVLWSCVMIFASNFYLRIGISDWYIRFIYREEWLFF